MEVQAALVLTMMPPASSSPISSCSASAILPSPSRLSPSPQPSSDICANTTSGTPSISITPVVAHENDSTPSWTFFPPSAAYIPLSSSTVCPSTTSATSLPLEEPTSPSSPSRSSRSSSPSAGSSLTTHGSCNTSSSSPSTHHRILDHCFHLSIETRLKQAEAQYLASAQEQALEQQQHHVKSGAGEGEGTDQDHDQVQDYDDWRRRQRSLVDEAVVLGRKGSNVEAIVDGILKSHRSNGPLQTLPRHLKHRLHLCQLTSMVFGRFDIASSTNNCAGLNIYSAFHSRRHGASRAAIKHHFEHSEQGKRLAPFFAHSVVPSSYCRRHHHKDCRRTFCTVAKLQQEQQQELELKKKIANNYFMNSNHHHTNVIQKQEHQRVTGLVDAIPAFLKCSAMSYRDIAKAMVEGGELQEAKDMRVLDGWYRLLLELMTQAVIESYLCDENIGFDTILDVFSFGDDPEDQATALKDFLALSQNSHSSSAENTDEVDPSSTHSTTGTGMEGLQFQSLSGLGATSTLGLPIKSQFSHQSSASTPSLHDFTTQDRQDDILFAKTPEYEIFKAAKDQRLQEILTLDGATMEQHFADLAATYPLIVFERQMTYFIARSQKLLVDPQLSQNHSMEAPMGLLIPPTTSSYADGSLSMPVSEDEDEDEDDDEDDGEDDTQTKLEGMKKEDEHEHEHRYQFPTPPATIVVIKEEKKKTTSVEDIDDDDNSTAARVVQVSKKHMHHHHHYHHHRQAEAATADLTSVDDAEHVAKKVKV